MTMPAIRCILLAGATLLILVCEILASDPNKSLRIEGNITDQNYSTLNSGSDHEKFHQIDYDKTNRKISIDQDEPNEIRFKLSATGLPPMDPQDGPPDPWAILEGAIGYAVTEVQNDTHNPEWNTTFLVIYLPGYTQVITVTVRDQDEGSQFEDIGKTDINVRDIFPCKDHYVGINNGYNGTLKIERVQCDGNGGGGRTTTGNTNIPPTTLLTTQPPNQNGGTFNTSKPVLLLLMLNMSVFKVYKSFFPIRFE